MVEPLADLPAIEKLSPRVIRILGGNPSKFTLQGTNTYIIGTGPSRLLIDTGDAKPAWLTSLKSVLATEHISIEKALLTHWHHDHIGGVPDLLSVLPKTLVHKHDPQEGWSDIQPNEVFKVEGATLKAYHSPGHTKDHMAFVLEEEDAMFTGDNVLGHGTAVFEDLATYVASLEGMATQFKGRGYPGHGPVIEDGPARVKEYIKHRKERERQVVDVLRAKEGGCSAREIVEVIYKDYPRDLWGPAEMGVVQILKKLEGEGKVVLEEGKWRLSGKAAL